MTRAARALADLVHETADRVALVEAIANFDKRMDTLDNIQELIEVELDGDELLADIEKAADFRDVCRKQRTAAKRLLSDISTTFNLQSSIISTRKGICRTGRVRDVHSRCVRLCERVFTTL